MADKKILSFQSANKRALIFLLQILLQSLGESERGRGKIKFSRPRSPSHVCDVVVSSLSGHQIKNVYIRKKQGRRERDRNC